MIDFPARRPRRRLPRARQVLPRDEVYLLIAAAAVTAALLFWVPWLQPLAYPFRLLLTLVHELSHGLAALATGGEFSRLVVSPDGSGLAYTGGGWRIIVIPAGYLGAAVFGAVLILLGPSPQASRWALGTVGVALVALSLRYGLPTLLTRDALGGLLAILAGCSFGLGAVLLALKAGGRWIVFALHLLAILAVLSSFSDLRTLIGLSGAGGGPATDAHEMAELALLPPIFWALLWAGLAALLVGAAIRTAWLGDSRLAEGAAGQTELGNS